MTKNKFRENNVHSAKIDERTEDRKAQQYIEESKTSYLKDLSYCGDGVKTGFEVCDDGNNISGDGCNADCSEIEQGFICSTDGALKEVCLSCPYGFYPNNSKDMCITICGDGIVEGNEECDDSNTINKDGCDSKCNLEKEITNLKKKRELATCTTGYKSQGPNCVPICGDGIRMPEEACDDGNTANGDGCNNSCNIIGGWVCSGGTTTTKDTCTQCTSGFVPNTAKDTCVPVCGDGFRVGTEACDDANTTAGDGCSATCTIETNYICTGGSATSRDTCSVCPAGFPPNSSNTVCVEKCGDGLRAGAEACDDANTAAGDGCSTTCTVETNSYCNGGSTTTKDTCVVCAAGYHVNGSNNGCVTVCGDGLRAGTEECDDQNSSSGDGCSSSCAIETSYVCSGGTTTTKDTCTFCTAGLYQNTGKTACETHCGDGLRAGTEVCDDQNTANSDGCSSTCTIESNYICTGGTTSSKDTCSACPAGQPPNALKTACQAVCGDGLRAGAETCDDQNTSNGDGCSSTCTIESNYICTGGTTSSKDTCSACPAGQPPNSLKTLCQEVCGDGLRAGAETCDDQNTSNGDGCTSTCTIESNYICTGGTTSSKDTCSACLAGQPPNALKTACLAVCGDGLRAGSEECDDQNTANSDGCSSTCTIEANYVCAGGSTATKDTCTVCTAGFYQNTGKSACETHCGDGKRAGTEACDDQNTSNSDGCSSTCTIESNYICTGGTTATKDTCSACAVGSSPDSTKTTCVVGCGNGLRTGGEECDDTNIINGDGCTANCLIEPGYVCSGGSASSKDSCTACASGFYQNSDKSACITRCGDGFLAGSEICDDGNTVNGDGCSSTCTVETTQKWVCHGGTSTTSDVCEVCGKGFNVNDSSNPRYCQSYCGDGYRVGSEVCDTGALSNSPCVKGCTTILAGFVCTGGDSNGADSCSQCPTSFTTNYNQSSCQVKPVTYAMEIYGYLYAFLMLVGIICNILSAYIFGYTFVSVFSILTHVQMLLLTPLIEVTVNENIISFYRMFKDVLLGFWFVSTKAVFVGYDRIFGYDTYSQTNWYLNVIGYDSASCIYTLGILFTISFILLAFYGIMQLANLAFIQQNSNNVLSRLVKQIVQFMTFKLFIRFSMLIFVCLLLGTLNTFAVNKRAKDHPASLTVSVVVYTLCVAFLMFSYVLTGVAVNGNQMTKMTNFAEFFNGVNLNFFSKWHSSINLTRFFLFCNILCIFAGDSATAKLVTIILLQALYIAYLCVVRPFKMLSDNVIDIFLEVCLFCYIIALSKFDADSSWSEADITVYIVFLFVAVSAYAVFSIGKFIFKLLYRSVKLSKAMQFKKDNTINDHLDFDNNQQNNELDDGYFEQDRPLNNLPSEEIEEIKIEDESVFICHPDQAKENKQKSFISFSNSAENIVELNNCQMIGDNDVPMLTENNMININSVHINFDEEES